jgi:methionyl aminopeptidase
MEEDLAYCRKAGKIHKQIKNEITEWIKPNMDLSFICNTIEDRIRELTNFDTDNPLQAGIAFPTGISINNCAAHWTPNPGDKSILLQNDVCKIDFGVHVNGFIADSAITIAFEDKYLPLLEASKTSTQIGIDKSGPDAHIGDISAEIEENLESYEIELNNNIHPIKSVKDLMGHQIKPYQIHAQKRVPNFKLEYNERMCEGEFYAIETFASSGNGLAYEGKECSHYMLNYTDNYQSIQLPTKDKKFLENIEKHFSTLAFCNRWLDKLKIKRYDHLLKNLIKANVVKKYPPLYDINNSYVAQFEHTIYINDIGREILS